MQYPQNSFEDYYPQKINFTIDNFISIILKNYFLIKDYYKVSELLNEILQNDYSFNFSEDEIREKLELMTQGVRHYPLIFSCAPFLHGHLDVDFVGDQLANIRMLTLPTKEEKKELSRLYKFYIRRFTSVYGAPIKVKLLKGYRWQTIDGLVIILRKVKSSFWKMDGFSIYINPQKFA